MAPASGQWAWMATVAAEELAKLEDAHPGRSLGPLKAELGRIIADPGWDDDDAVPLAFLGVGVPSSSQSQSQPAAPPDLTPLTQGTYTRIRPCAFAACYYPLMVVLARPAESSTEKRKWVGGGAAVDREKQRKRRRRKTEAQPRAKKDRADMLIERAEEYLKMIRAVKHSLRPCSED